MSLIIISDTNHVQTSVVKFSNCFYRHKIKKETFKIVQGTVVAAKN